MTMKKMPAVLAFALAFGLSTTPSAQAGIDCGDGGDPVYDPGSPGKCEFAVSPVVPGGEASVRGRLSNGYAYAEPSSYLKDTADDGQAAHLWLRTVQFGLESEWVVATASGPGVAVGVSSADWGQSEMFLLRVCVGEGTANCSGWQS